MMFNVVFPAFVTEEGDPACAPISIVDDLELEGDEQSFSIHISTVDPPNLTINQFYATVVIQDNDDDGKNMVIVMVQRIVGTSLCFTFLSHYACRCYCGFC